MAITASQVNELRQKTGLGMMECKQALTEANGDMQSAVDLLRKKGLAKMDSRADRVSAEGRVAVALAPDHSKAAIVEINTETDFVAKGDEFGKMVTAVAIEALQQPAGDVQKTDAIQKLIDDVRLTSKENVQFARGKVLGGPGSKVGSYVHFTNKIGVVIEVVGQADDALLADLCMHITAASPTPISVDETGIPKEIIEKEKEIAKAQAIEQGKPEAIAEKMVIGKVRKFIEENTLLDQVFIKDPESKKKVKDMLPKGVTVKGFVRCQLGVK